jgi:ABC-type phosphate transport system auxiliary subunit
MIILTGACESNYRNFLKDCADMYGAALSTKSERAVVEIPVELMKTYLETLLDKDEYMQLVGRISEQAAKRQITENSQIQSNLKYLQQDIRGLEDKMYDVMRELSELKEKGAVRHENH